MANNVSFWATKDDNKPDLLCGRPADYFVVKKHFTILVFATIALGGFSRMLFKNSEVFVLMILSLSGFVTGQLAYHFVEVHQVVDHLLKTPSFSLYCYFLPLIVFMAALDVDFYIVKNLLWQVLLTGVISFGISFFIIGYVVLKFNEDSWDLQCCVLFTITLCMIDPFHSVNSLKTIGISRMYTNIIRGESLIICSFACIFFGVFRGHSTNVSMFKELHMLIGSSFAIFGSIICGYCCARVFRIVLTDLFSNTLTIVVLCFSLIYLTFYLVEFFGMSGIVALVVVGLNLDSLSFKPRMELIITKFLIIYSRVFEYLIYAFFGIVIGCGEIKYFRFHSLVFTVILFVTVNFVRLLTIIIVSPILMHSSYEYDWRWGVVITCSGIRGAFSLLLASDIYNFAEQKIDAPHMFIFYIQVLSLLTMGINSHMMLRSARTLGLCAPSLLRQTAMKNAIHHIQTIIRNTITLFKSEKLLTNVNWNVVEDKAKTEYHSVSHGEKESPTDEVLIEEARLRLAIIQMSSFKKQCNDGILDVEAARVLIGATKSYCPIQGKFMSIADVSTYVRARSWLIMFKNTLTYLDYYQEKILFTVPRSNKFLTFVYYIIISEEFEYATHIVTVIYIFPMIIHLWPMARELHASALLSINCYFIFLYTLNATLKILILKRKYFHLKWNNLDFLIIIIGIIDILCLCTVKLRPDSLFLTKFTAIIGYFRVIRFLPIFKIIIPILINIVDVRIKRSLSLMYSITEGYIKSQEDAKLLVRQISNRESVYKKLCDILEKNKQDAVRELGLIEHEGRDVVRALKTKQAIRTVFTKALEHLTFLRSRGLINRREGIELNKIFLTKIKALDNFPKAIPPPTPDKYFPNIIWMENNDVLIEFFKLHSSSPTFGIDGSKRDDRPFKTMYTEYCRSGDVLAELSCLLYHENEYTAISETSLQAFFISIEDLYEGFDVFWPSLEYKIWLKVALGIANQYFGSSIAGEELKFQKCVMFKNAYVETLSNYNEMALNHETMKFVILVYGHVINTKTEEPYVAPIIIPKSCEQIQGILGVNKLLIITVSEPTKSETTSHAMAGRWTSF